MPADLPEPSVVPTPIAPPVSGRLVAAFLVLGVMGIFVGVAKPPVQAGSAPTVAEPHESGVRTIP